jgi:uncharacterized membrane protein YagU involved in acid resistance
MSAGMALHKALTGTTLGPGRVTERFVEGADAAPSEPVLHAATAVNHLAFGAGAGALYGVVRRVVPAAVPASLSGTVYGLAVWAASYAGWIPALRILPPPTEDRPDRAVGMHLHHWVYGASLGLLEQRLRGVRTRPAA